MSTSRKTCLLPDCDKAARKNGRYCWGHRLPANRPDDWVAPPQGPRAGRNGTDRKHWLKSRYGLSLDDYQTMAYMQGGLCAVCGRQPRLLVVDHHHGTGKVRGLLCPRCNTAMHAVDEPELLAKLIEYHGSHL